MCLEGVPRHSGSGGLQGRSGEAGRWGGETPLSSFAFLVLNVCQCYAGKNCNRHIFVVFSENPLCASS